MRHVVGDNLFVTDGRGIIYETVIRGINKNNVIVEILKSWPGDNIKSNIYFCIPKLKSPDRFEFALEKCVELGITGFIIYESKRTVSRGERIERWNKILVSAMKQSLLSFLPVITTASSLKEIISLPGIKIAFEQGSDNDIRNLSIEQSLKHYFIFGPEGGLDKEELALFNPENIYKLAENRLRSETAIVKAASIL
jgi:16S rRNA (uracil1498-N3)-methyltransferase